MTDRQRELVQCTWEYVLPMSSIAVELFYAALFREDPSLRSFVAERIIEQKRGLKSCMSILVRALDEPENLPAVVRRIAQRHSGFDLQYATPGAARNALLQTLREILGPLYTAEVEDAWIALLELVRALSAHDTRTREPSLSVK